jgi:curved DNA-binding protein CbpA
MVRPESDASVDYFMLLEVPIDADAQEVKKQYRKLGARNRNLFS